MSDIYWLNPVNGLFTDAADWSGGVVPGVSDDAILNATGRNYTVTVANGATVNSIQLASNATLAITGRLAAAAGTGTGANAGKIVVDDGSGEAGSAYFYIGGTFDNSGSVVLGDNYNYNEQCTLWLESNTTLTGGGAITLSDADGNSISAEASETLTNVDNKISGNGALYLTALVNESRGVIDANGSSLSMATGNIENDGRLEASGSRQGFFVALYISNAIVTGTHGTIVGAAGGQIVVNGCTVTGQTLSTQAGGRIVVYQSTATVGGRISNAGTLWLEDTGVLSLGKSATLTGGGSVFLDYFTALITANKAATLTNFDNVIDGSGAIAGSTLTFVNQAGGIVEAVNEDSGYGNRITIDTAGNTIANAGLMQADTGAILTIESPISNTGVLAASGGKLKVMGAVTGTGDATIAGGTLKFKSSFDEAVTFTDGSGMLELAQSQSYTAAISGFAVDGGTSLDLRDIDFVDAGEATFSGTQTGGVLTVTDGTHTASINLVGDYTSSTFTASSNGKGGVDVVAANAQTPSVEHFASAMAAMTGHGVAAGLIDARTFSEGRQMMLTAPRLAIA